MHILDDIKRSSVVVFELKLCPAENGQQDRLLASQSEAAGSASADVAASAAEP